MASEFPDIPHNMRKVYRRFERWRGARTNCLPFQTLAGHGSGIGAQE